MKKILLVILSLSIYCQILAQENYITSDAQMIFSFANVKDNGSEISSPLRWSPVFNFGSNFHNDMSEKFGMFIGLNVKNIGFIADRQIGTEPRKEIHRSYNLGIPIAFKVGDLDKAFVYFGYEFELPLNYKYKAWDSTDRSGSKTSFNNWFSDATPTTMHSIILGFQFIEGTNIRFKYYLNEFLNQDYIRDGVKINDGLEAQVFSISFVSSFLKDFRFYY